MIRGAYAIRPAFDLNYLIKNTNSINIRDHFKVQLPFQQPETLPCKV
jgi:hypothetical protein